MALVWIRFAVTAGGVIFNNNSFGRKNPDNAVPCFVRIIFSSLFRHSCTVPSFLHRSVIPAPFRHSCTVPSFLHRSVIPAPFRHSCTVPSFLHRSVIHLCTVPSSCESKSSQASLYKSWVLLQFQFPCSLPFLDLLFARNRRIHISMQLEIDQKGNVIFLAKSFD